MTADGLLVFSAVCLGVNVVWMVANWRLTVATRRWDRAVDERSVSTWEHSRAVDKYRESLEGLERAREAKLAAALAVIDRKTVEEVTES